MPNIKEHRKFARDLARMLKIDADMAEAGSVIPDFDLIKPLKHRKTLHNAKLLAFLVALGSFNPEVEALAVGHASHMVLDLLGADKMRIIRKLMEKFNI